MKKIINRALAADKKLFFILAAVLMTASVWATEHSYVWGEEFPNYKQQTPSSDFTTNDDLFRFTSDKANGVSGPQFGEDSKAGLLLRLYADNTLRIESLKGKKITAITFVIGGNGHYKLANLTPSNGAMGEPYLGKDATDSYREYRLFWTGNTTDVTFTVGHECEYGIDCAEQGETGVAGTCMTKQIIITTADEMGVDEVSEDAPGTRKIIYNGKVYILQEGNTYTLTGKEIKKGPSL